MNFHIFINYFSLFLSNFKFYIMLKKISTLGSILNGNEKKKISGGKISVAPGGGGHVYWVYCTCDDGSEYTVGATRTESKIWDYINECKADGGTPRIYQSN